MTEKRKTILITAGAIAAAGGLVGALEIFFKHQKSKDAILVERTEQISEEVVEALGATSIGPHDGRRANAETIYAGDDEQFPEEDMAEQTDYRSPRNVAARIIRLVTKQPDQSSDT